MSDERALTKYRLRTVQISVARDKPGRLIEGPEDAARWAHAVYDRVADWDKENVGLLALNVRGQIAGFKIVAVGTKTSALVHPRDFFLPSLLMQAVSVICVHCHPSGNPTPSIEDFELTDRLAQAGDILGVPLVDHIIITECGRYASAMPER